jgi:hypothetical protein
MDKKTNFDPEKVNALRTEIDNKFQEFMQNSSKETNRAGALRARKNTLDLEKLFKTYRKLSIKIK